MKLVLFLILAAILIYGGSVSAQDSKLGTTRSEDLQLKAKIEYEKRNQKQPQQVQKQAPAAKPVAPAESTAKKTETPPNPQPQPDPTAQVTTSAMGKNVVCKHNSETRNLYIESKGQGCELFYTKMGTTKSQARQNFGTKICDSVFESMKATLEKTGFVCEPKTN